MKNDQKNLLAQIERLEKMSDEIEQNLEETNREVSSMYRQRLEDLLFDRQIDLNNEHREKYEKIRRELNEISLNEKAFVDLVYRTILQLEKRLVSRYFFLFTSKNNVFFFRKFFR